MALLFMDGLGAYSTGTKTFGSQDDLLLNFNQWAEVLLHAQIEDVTEGRRGYITINGTGDNMDLRPKFNTAFSEATVVMGMRFYWQPSNEEQMLAAFHNGGNFIGFWAVTDGGLMYYTIDSQARPAIADQIFATKPLRPNAWNYVEIKVFFNGSTGTVNFYVNGQAAGAYTSLDTELNAGPCTEIRIGYDQISTIAHGGSRYADIYVDDTNVHGPMNIYYQPCDSAGSSAGFTPLASTNQSQVDEYGMDGDTTYNASTAPVTLDQLGHSDSLSIAPIALQPMVMARYVPTGSANIQVGLKSGATHDQDAEVGLTDAYDGVPGKIYELDPNTAAAWSSTNANAAETSYEHSS